MRQLTERVRMSPKQAGEFMSLLESSGYVADIASPGTFYGPSEEVDFERISPRRVLVTRWAFIAEGK